MGGRGKHQQQKKQKTKDRGKKKRKSEKERTAAAEELVMKWAGAERLTPGLFDLHAHSTCSDGLLSPERLVGRAFRNGVRVLALTDHDTMAGVPAALQAARQHGIRVIPGIEISAKYVTRSNDRAGSTMEEPVHVLAYYGCCGPSNRAQLEERLAQVREGRYRRAEEMVKKLKLLHKPITLEHVLHIAGEGVAPARPHVARALVEAGHVEDVGEAFLKYLHNDGPAYARGAELPAEEVVNLIQETGGISALAHPWALKNPMPLIEHLKSVGLHAMEVYKRDGRCSVFGPLAEAYKLVKLGGSDYHARGTLDETDLGGVELPPLAVHQFLKLAEPIWSSAVESILGDFARHTTEITESCSASIYAEELRKGDTCLTYGKLPGTDQIIKASLTLSPWLSEEGRNLVEEMASRLGLMHTLVNVEGRKALVVSRFVTTSAMERKTNKLLLSIISSLQWAHQALVDTTLRLMSSSESLRRLTLHGGRRIRSPHVQGY